MVVKRKTAVKTAAKAVTKTAKTETVDPDSSNDERDELGAVIVSQIIAGAMDDQLAALDTALGDRLTAIQDQEAKETTRPVAKKEKGLPTAPKSESKPAGTLKVGTVYVINASKTKVHGFRVKFIRPKADFPDKSLVEVAQDYDGYPKGKKFSVPSSTLENAPTKVRAK